MYYTAIKYIHIVEKNITEKRLVTHQSTGISEISTRKKDHKERVPKEYSIIKKKKKNKKLLIRKSDIDI